MNKAIDAKKPGIAPPPDELYMGLKKAAAVCSLMYVGSCPVVPVLRK